MNKELNDFFEDKKTPVLKKQTTLTRYLTIRFMCLFLPVILFLAILTLAKSEYGLLFLLAAYLYPAIWFVFIIIETIVFHFREKFKLRNINLILIAICLPIYFIILINHP